MVIILTILIILIILITLIILSILSILIVAIAIIVISFRRTFNIAAAIFAQASLIGSKHRWLRRP